MTHRAAVLDLWSLKSSLVSGPAWVNKSKQKASRACVGMTLSRVGFDTRQIMAAAFTIRVNIVWVFVHKNWPVLVSDMQTQEGR